MRDMDVAAASVQNPAFSKAGAVETPLPAPETFLSPQTCTILYLNLSPFTCRYY